MAVLVPAQDSVAGNTLVGGLLIAPHRNQAHLEPVMSVTL